MAVAWWLTADVRDGLDAIPDGSIDLVLTSPPFLALRSYLPADHPDKALEIGSEATPAEFLSTLLGLSDEFARVLAPHGSICVELGDSYAGSGGSGGDYNEGGLREGQAKWQGTAAVQRGTLKSGRSSHTPWKGARDGWPLSKSLTMVPTLYPASLAYGRNLLTGEPCRQWRVRNLAPWVRNNPPVGELGDKFRPGSSYMTVACLNGRRWWDELGYRDAAVPGQNLLDWVHCDGSGYPGAHFATWPADLIGKPIKAMCPLQVCEVCGRASERIVESQSTGKGFRRSRQPGDKRQTSTTDAPDVAIRTTVGWTDCGHNAWRNGRVLDPFGGSGTTAMVTTGHGRDCMSVDLDGRNADLAYERVGGLIFREVGIGDVAGLLAAPAVEEGVA